MRLSGDVVSNANLEAVKLSQPIRTMVIGFADPTDTDSKTQALVKALNDMADYGDDGALNNSAHAYFANDVPGASQRNAPDFGQRNAELQGSAAPMMIDPQVVEDAGTAEAYSPNYKRQGNLDQWKGIFYPL